MAALHSSRPTSVLSSTMSPRPHGLALTACAQRSSICFVRRSAPNLATGTTRFPVPLTTAIFSLLTTYAAQSCPTLTLFVTFRNDSYRPALVVIPHFLCNDAGSTPVLQAWLDNKAVQERFYNGGSVLHECEDGPDRRYVRRDQRMSKLVYRSQVVRDVFGSGVARFFMNLMRVEASVARRVLRSPGAELRR